jgi:small subunit ribosomal protein S13
MPRLVGVDIPQNKQIVIGLSYIYGIGPSNSKKILDMAKIEHNRKASTLTAE